MSRRIYDEQGKNDPSPVCGKHDTSVRFYVASLHRERVCIKAANTGESGIRKKISTEKDDSTMVANSRCHLCPKCSCVREKLRQEKDTKPTSRTSLSGERKQQKNMDRSVSAGMVSTAGNRRAGFNSNKDGGWGWIQLGIHLTPTRGRQYHYVMPRSGTMIVPLDSAPASPPSRRAAYINLSAYFTYKGSWRSAHGPLTRAALDTKLSIDLQHDQHTYLLERHMRKNKVHECDSWISEVRLDLPATDTRVRDKLSE